MKLLPQIGFMPEALSTKPQPYRHHWKCGANLPTGMVQNGKAGLLMYTASKQKPTLEKRKGYSVYTQKIILIKN